MQFGVGAAGLAVSDSGLDLARRTPKSVGVVMGTGIVPMDLAEVAAAIRAAGEDGKLRTDRLGSAAARRRSRCGSSSTCRTWWRRTFRWR